MLILRYELHCQSFEQLSPIHRQLAWCAVWHGMQRSTVCSVARCAVCHGVQCGMVCSVAWCAVWHGVQCGMVCSVALRATALFTQQHPPLEWLLPHRNLAEGAGMQERCLLWFILCRSLPSPRRVHFKRVVPACSFCSELLLFDLQKCNSCFRVPHWPVQKCNSCFRVPHWPVQKCNSCFRVPLWPVQKCNSCFRVPLWPVQKCNSCFRVPLWPVQKCNSCFRVPLWPVQKCNSCFRVPHWPVQKAIKADSLYSHWMTVPRASFCDVLHHHILDHRLVWDRSCVHSLMLLCKPLYTLWCCASSTVHYDFRLLSSLHTCIITFSSCSFKFLFLTVQLLLEHIYLYVLVHLFYHIFTIF